MSLCSFYVVKNVHLVCLPKIFVKTFIKTYVTIMISWKISWNWFYQ